MITYNHELFVEQAVESIMSQQAPFEVRLEISDDASTDGTAVILESLRQRFPGAISLHLNEHNVGAIENFFGAISRATGRYVAICEGDDYWCDPEKLAKQVAILEAHPTASICFSDVWVKYEDGPRAGSPMRLNRFRGARVTTLSHLIMDNYIPTCTVVFRRRGALSWPDWAGDVLHGDWVLHLMNAAHGEIVHLPEVTGVYRRHAGGVWSARSTSTRVAGLLRSNMMLDRLDRATNHRFARPVRNGKAKSFLRMARLYMRDGELRAARSAALRCIAMSPSNPEVRTSEVIDILIRTSVPKLRPWLKRLRRG